MNFPADEVGIELLNIYELTGVPPFENVEHQGQLTPLQRRVIAEGSRLKREKTEEEMDTGGRSRPRNSARTTKEGIMRKNARQKYGAGSATYVNEDFSPDKPLVMDDDELMTPPDGGTE